MQVRITPSDLITSDGKGPRGISPQRSSEAAAILYGLIRIDEAENVSARVEISNDHLHGGFLQLAIQAAKCLDDVINFERYDGVFVYDHLEWGQSLTLGRWLTDHITDGAMYQVAHNYSLVGIGPLRDVITQWAAALDLPLTSWATARLGQLRIEQPKAGMPSEVAQLRAKLEYLQKRTSEVTEALLKATGPYADK